MARLLIGDDEFNGRIVCDGSIDTECQEFTNYGDGVRIFHLYTDEGYIDTADLVLERRPIGSTEWEFSSEWRFGNGENYVYMTVTINVSDYEYMSTYKGITKYYTIHAVEEPCPAISCGKIELPIATCYRGESVVAYLSWCSVEGEVEYIYYEWYINHNQVVGNVSPHTIDTTYLSVGEHVISARAVTSCGTASELLSITLTVEEPVVDPCEGVTCPDYCDYINHIKYYNGVCNEDTGECIYYTDMNSEECGFDPCEGVLPNWVCQVDGDGNNTGWMIDQNNCYEAIYDETACPLSVIDPCDGVTCPDYCDLIHNDRYYNGTCDPAIGECVYDTELDSIECGYEAPSSESNIAAMLLPIGIGIGLLTITKK